MREGSGGEHAGVGGGRAPPPPQPLLPPPPPPQPPLPLQPLQPPPPPPPPPPPCIHHVPIFETPQVMLSGIIYRNFSQSLQLFGSGVSLVSTFLTLGCYGKKYT